MRNLTILLALAALTGGCNWNSMTEYKAQSAQRWQKARATVVTGVGVEYLKTGEMDKARNSAAEALSLDRDCVAARVLMGKALIGKGQYADAIEQLRVAEAALPNSGEIKYLLGAAFEKQTKYPEALGYYQEARALDEGNVGYLTASAEVLVAMNRVPDALELVQVRIERGCCENVVLTLAGDLCMMLQRYAEAVDYYQRGLDVKPDVLDTRENLIKAAYLAGQYDLALTTVKALVLLPDYHEKSSWVYLTMGDCYMALNHAGDARGAYESATNLEPEEPAGWAGLAKAALAGGDTARAILSARKALTLAGDNPAASFVLGYALLREGRLEEARKVLQPAAGKHPLDATLLCTLGRCYAAQGKNELAADCYRQALKSDPRNVLAKRLLLSAAG
jgi:tetratricopeptide (TPR) repeat protein